MTNSKVVITFFLILGICDLGLGYTREALDDQINDLPGLTFKPTFNHFSGYLTVDEKNGRNLHYWFVESENNPSTDPLLLWSNGGPGCSGLIGFMTEQGPFRPNKELELDSNPYAWNKIANVIFIEAPAGVGFSYSDTPSDLITGDFRTAEDNYQAILQFLVRFPEYANREFYISGESYGGHYMPTLAKAIVDHNTEGSNQLVNFKGFLVGNPYTDANENVLGAMDTLHGHQLVSEETYAEWRVKCRPVYLKAMRRRTTASLSSRCHQLEGEMNSQYGNLNPYALDFPVCLDGDDDNLSAGGEVRSGLGQRLALLNAVRPAQWLEASRTRSLAAYEPCENSYATHYLNREDVKLSIGVSPNITWAPCSNALRYNNSDMAVPMEPIYQYLIDGGFGLDILIYSGDDDDVCATSGTTLWLPTLGYNETSSWKAWTDTDGQVGGYLTKYTGLNFVTVHGAGHEVPTYQPARALEVLRRYLKREW